MTGDDIIKLGDAMSEARAAQVRAIWSTPLGTGMDCPAVIEATKALAIASNAFYSAVHAAVWGKPVEAGREKE